ncbi:unnamed protein product [Rhizophagus irregularis]|uniref:Serine-threonine/tyrosine-protein kinase catalytic domain-containing protein n=1 Tax=Rhizophagus irregularis TaxID=588596 RepID=A0A915ZCF0_9GLOM|nr:unnamed protein product [Rhizophagus irregularis]
MFGITKDPTSSYMIVMKYYENGNLYQYLDHCNEIILGEMEIWSICYGESLEVLKESIPRENSRKSSRRKLTCRTDEKVSTDARIADDICDGKRLEIPEDTPRFYSELRQCRDDDPKKRPTVLYLNKIQIFQTM